MPKYSMTSQVIVLVLLIFLISGCATPQSKILKNDQYSKLLIEVIPVSYCNPTKADLDYLVEKAKYYCHKDTVELVVDPEIEYTAIPTLFWTENTLTYFEKSKSKCLNTNNTLVIRILYLPGVLTPECIARGVAYGNYSFALFTWQMDQSHERPVLLHEFGHLLQTPKSSDINYDKNHPYHCNLKSCVMFWNSPDGQSPDFCKNCQESLKD